SRRRHHRGRNAERSAVGASGDRRSRSESGADPRARAGRYGAGCALRRDMSGAAVEVWRGCANAWECDHIGHLNTRYYVVRIEQALAALARRLGLAEVNDSKGQHHLLVKAQHMRFLREARAGAALHATGQVLSWRRDEADVLFLL